MIYVKDEICEAIQKHNKFIPCYNTLTEAHECLTDYELVTTLYREKTEINRALEEANKLKTPVFVGEIGPLKSFYEGVDYVEVYVTNDKHYLTKRINIS